MCMYEKDMYCTHMTILPVYSVYTPTWCAPHFTQYTPTIPYTIETPFCSSYYMSLYHTYQKHWKTGVCKRNMDPLYICRFFSIVHITFKSMYIYLYVTYNADPFFVSYIKKVVFEKNIFMYQTTSYLKWYVICEKYFPNIFFFFLEKFQSLPLSFSYHRYAIYAVYPFFCYTSIILYFYILNSFFLRKFCFFRFAFGFCTHKSDENDNADRKKNYGDGSGDGMAAASEMNITWQREEIFFFFYSIFRKKNLYSRLFWFMFPFIWTFFKFFFYKIGIFFCLIYFL